MAEAATWIDLLDPDRAQLEAEAPRALHPRALDRLLEPARHGDEPRPSLEAHRDYVFGVFLVPVAERETDDVYYQEVDLVVTRSAVLTVRKTPDAGEPFDCDAVKELHGSGHVKTAGSIAYQLVDEVAERFLDLIDALDDEIDELEDKVETWPGSRVRERLSALRHDLLHIRRTLAPTRDAVRRIVDGRVDVEGEEVFDRDLEVEFGMAYDKLLRASEGLELARDLVAGVRDYYQAKVAQDQNEVMKRLTAIASLLLLPTFIVGLYGQNFRHHFPELGWSYGYAFSWALILGSTAIQLWIFRRKRWI